MPKRRTKSGDELEDNVWVNGNSFRYCNPITKVRTSLGTDVHEANRLARALNNKYTGSNGIDLLDRGGISNKKLNQVIDEYIENYLPQKPWKKNTRSIRIGQAKRFSREFGAEYIRAIDRVFIGDWLVRNTPSNESYNKNRDLLVDIFKYAISRNYIDFNEAGATLKRSLSKEIAGNQTVRQRLTTEQFNAIKEKAPTWLQLAMDLSLVTLQSRNEIVNMKHTDIRDNRLFVVRAKTSTKSNTAFIKIKLTPQINEIIQKTKDDNIHCPYIIHCSPKRRLRNQIAAKPHWAYVTPDHLTKTFKKVRDSLECFADMKPRERPTFHEIRSLGGRIYIELGFSKQYVKSLMTHAEEQTTDIYLEDGKVTDERYIEVNAELTLMELPVI